MIEKLYTYKESDARLVERIIDDENANVNHMIFKQGDALPEHDSNSNVYMIVIKGTVSLQLDKQESNEYPKGSIINIPFNTKMNVSNQNRELLEIFVIKAPSPKNYKNT